MAPPLFLFLLNVVGGGRERRKSSFHSRRRRGLATGLHYVERESESGFLRGMTEVETVSLLHFAIQHLALWAPLNRRTLHSTHSFFSPLSSKSRWWGGGLSSR